jgi:hypothetical protein
MGVRRPRRTPVLHLCSERLSDHPDRTCVPFLTFWESRLDIFDHVQPERRSDKAVARIVKRRAKAVGLDPARCGWVDPPERAVLTVMGDVRAFIGAVPYRRVLRKLPPRPSDASLEDTHERKGAT